MHGDDLAVKRAFNHKHEAVMQSVETRAQTTTGLGITAVSMGIGGSALQTPTRSSSSVGSRWRRS
jgi:hypothetical protein